MGKRTSVTKELLLFIKQNKAYWIAPIIVVVILLTTLIIFSAATGGAATPFIYTLF